MKTIIKNLSFIAILMLLVFSLPSCGVEPKVVDTDQITRGEQGLNDQCLADSTYYGVRFDEHGRVFIIDPETKLTKYQIKNYDDGESILVILGIFVFVLLFCLGFILSHAE